MSRKTEVALHMQVICVICVGARLDLLKDRMNIVNEQENRGSPPYAGHLCHLCRDQA